MQHIENKLVKAHQLQTDTLKIVQRSRNWALSGAQLTRIHISEAVQTPVMMLKKHWKPVMMQKKHWKPVMMQKKHWKPVMMQKKHWKL
uniref:Alternative protein n=1 Tax=Globodera pallida TaxID=36090 RepID=A0A183CEW9_GLOPA